MIFYKTVSCGNDFIHIDMQEYHSAAAPDASVSISKDQLARQICNRNTGAGADGVVYYNISRETTVVDFQIFNRDGSEAELSGNGMAGLSALLFYLQKSGGRDYVVLNTKAGPKKNTCLDRENNKFRLKIEIGTANFQDRDFFPFLEKDKWEYRYDDITFYPVSVGNPHAVVLVEEDTQVDNLEQMGRILESAPIFPLKTNVEFVFYKKTGFSSEEKREYCRVFYYERGVGQTRSSSTGSAAVFAVLQKLALINSNLTIPVADESIKISGSDRIYIENSTQIVYKGVYFLS